MDVPAGRSRVQVFARVRPAGFQEDQSAIQIDEVSGVVRTLIVGDAPSGEVALAERRDFTFDGVFPEGAPQEQVFAKVGLPILQECLQGFNGTILAYGQTGSGKSHSLLNRGQDSGLLPRLVEALFDRISNDVTSVYTVEAAAMQVYNEQLDDLLHAQHQSGGGHGLVVQNGGFVPDLTWITCQTPEQMSRLFFGARANLIYAETKMNKASSRSHAVFQIRVTKRRCLDHITLDEAIQGDNTVCSLMNVIDLAGSERNKKSGADGVHFKEATMINKSLLALGNVVSALAVKKAHVPFRDSKLTRLLEKSLGGNCKTVLLVCANPKAEHIHETINSFEFASRAMRIELNPRQNCTFVDSRRSSFSLAAESTNEPQVDASAHAREVEHLQIAVREASTRAEQAEARAASAEHAAVGWQQKAESTAATCEALLLESQSRHAAMEAQMDKEKRLAANSIARLRAQIEGAQNTTTKLESDVAEHNEQKHLLMTELAATKAALEQSQAEVKSCKESLHRELAAARTAMASAEKALVEAPAPHQPEGCTTKRFLLRAAERLCLDEEETMALNSILSEKERLAQDAIEQEEVGAAQDEDTPTTQRDGHSTPSEASLDALRNEQQVRLRAGLERLAEAKKRSEVEFSRRLDLAAGREQDSQTILKLQEQNEEQLRELHWKSREISELRRRLRKCECGTKTEISKTLSTCTLTARSRDDVPDKPQWLPVAMPCAKDGHGPLHSLALDFRRCQSVKMLPPLSGSRSRAATPS